MIRARDGALSSVERWKMGMKMMREVQPRCYGTLLNLARGNQEDFATRIQGSVALSSSLLAENRFYADTVGVCKRHLLT